VGDVAGLCPSDSASFVLADLGLPNPEQELKAGLTLQIFRVLKARRLTQAQAGKVLGIPQPHVSDLLNGRARGFSAERLMEFLAALSHDVEVRVKPTRKAHGHVSVVVAA
jgi:predicted XRE-type DNA-binding protein